MYACKGDGRRVDNRKEAVRETSEQRNEDEHGMEAEEEIEHPNNFRKKRTVNNISLFFFIPELRWKRDWETRTVYARTKQQQGIDYSTITSWSELQGKTKREGEGKDDNKTDSSERLQSRMFRCGSVYLSPQQSYIYFDSSLQSSLMLSMTMKPRQCLNFQLPQFSGIWIQSRQLTESNIYRRGSRRLALKDINNNQNNWRHLMEDQGSMM